MKKVLYFFAAVALLFGVASCQKDKDEPPAEAPITTQQAGVYNPGMKICRIYRQKDNGEKELQEAWRWKDNKLIEILYGNDRYTYTYQNNRLSKMELYGREGLYYFSCAYYYEGANFSKIEYDEDGDHDDYTAEFDYKNGKISSVYVYYESFQDVIDFTWDGDNVSSVHGDGHTDTFTYDGKNNPYCGSFLIVEGSGGVSLSKNNVTKAYRNGKLDYEYSYEYNSKGYPVKKISTNDWGSYTNTTTTYYEYLED